MPRKLKPSIIRWIAIRVGRLDPRNPVGWTDVEAIAKERTSGITRQWLAQQPRIRKAYEDKRAQHRTWKKGGEVKTRRVTPLEQARETNRRLRLIIAEREKELANYDIMLATMLLAARDADVPQEFLMRSLAPEMRSAKPHLANRRKRG